MPERKPITPRTEQDLPAGLRGRGAVDLRTLTRTEQQAENTRRAWVDAAFPQGTRVQGRANEVGVEPLLLIASTGNALNRMLSEYGREPLPIVVPAKGNVQALEAILKDEYPEEEVRRNIYLSRQHGDATAPIRFDPKQGFLKHLDDITARHGEVQDNLARLEEDGFTGVSLIGEERLFEKAPKVITINTGSPVEVADRGSAVEVFPRSWSHIPAIMEEFPDLYSPADLDRAARMMPVAMDTLSRMGIISRTMLHTVERLDFFQRGSIRPYPEDIINPLTPPVKEAKISSGNVVIDKENGLIFTQTEKGTETHEFPKGSKVAYLNISFSNMAKGEAIQLVEQLQSMDIVVLGPEWLHKEIPSIQPSGPDIFYQMDQEEKSVVDFILARPGLGIIYHSLLAEVPGLYFSDITNKEDPEILANKLSVEAHGVGIALDVTPDGVSEMQLRDALTRLPQLRTNIQTLQKDTYKYGNIPEGQSGPDVIANQIMRKELGHVQSKMETFLHPEAIGIRLPRTSKELYAALDTDLVDFWVKGAVVRDRYPLTAKRIDDIYGIAETAYVSAPDDEQAKKAYLQAIGLTGFYNYIRGMEVITAEGEVDRDVAPKMMLSPSASLQLLETAQISEEDTVLDMFCGTGYATFALGTANPSRIDAIDNFTIPRYQLPKTMDRAYSMIYKDVPDALKPPVTRPTFIEEDCASLPDFDGQDAAEKGFAEHYSKVFLHPPYGRESTKMMPSITEGDAFILWVNSLRSVNKANKGDATVFSIVPEEWHGAIRDIIDTENSMSVEDAVGVMYDRLRGIKYYSFDDNTPKLSEPTDYDKAADWDMDELRSIFANSSTDLLEETGMFGLHLHKITLP